MTLSDVNIGQRFRFKKGQQVWVKDTVQGMWKQMSYCHTEKKYNTRRPNDPQHRNKMFEQTTEIFEIL